MHSRIGLAVDSSCDLSPEFIQQHNIEVLPTYIHHKGGALLDTRDLQSMTQFYQKPGLEKARSEPLSVNEATRIIQDKLLPKYDRVNVITGDSSKSEVFKRLSEAALINEPHFRQLASADKKRPPFRMRMVDTLATSTGHALLVHAYINMVEKQRLAPSEAINRINELRDHVFNFVILNDLSQLKVSERSQRQGINISWLNRKMARMLNICPVIKIHRGNSEPLTQGKGFQAALETLLDHVRSKIKQGLAFDTITVSYAGLTDEIEKNSSLVAFTKFAQQHGIEVELSMMSTAAAIHLGPKAFSLAFAITEESLI